MTPLRHLRPAALLFASLTFAGCAAPEDGSDSTSDAVSTSRDSSSTSAAVDTVKAYYAAPNAADPLGALEPLVADDIVLEAPSVRILKHQDQLVGKEAFMKLAASFGMFLKAVKVREIVPASDTLVIARIDLPLPNGDTITQIEYFEVRGGRIEKFQSYYDGLRFVNALPAIALAKVKAALGIES